MKLLDVEVSVGPVRTIGSLGLFPLLCEGGPETPACLSGPEALEHGIATVHELESPQVPSLQVQNLAETPVLLIEGECLLGGDQNRTVNVSVICPPKATTVVPVTCVEAGRWGGRRAVASASQQSPGNLRRAKTRSILADIDGGPRSTRNHSRTSDQGEVWEEVDRYSVSHCVSSPTSALADVQEQLRPRIDELTRNLELEAGQCGAIYCIGGRVVGMDIFDQARTCESYLRGIVAGYLLDSFEDAGDATVSQAEVERFLRSLDSAEISEAPGVGLGKELRLVGDEVFGIGITLDDRLVHLAAFAA